MSRAALLDLLSRLISSHEALDGPNVEIIRVVVDDLPAIRPTVEAAVRYAGGMMLDAAVLETPFPPGSDDALRAAIEVYLSVERPGAAAPLTFAAAGGGLMNVQIAGREPDSASQAETELAGLAAALFHRDLPRSELVVVSYTEDVLDIYGRRAAWELVSRGLCDPKIGYGSARTIVVLVEASTIDTPRHGAHRSGLTHALSQGRAIRRNAPEDLAAQASLLAASAAPLLFLGAGFARSSRLPLGNELRDEAMRRQLGSQTLSGEELSRAYYRWALSTERLPSFETRLGEQRFVESVTLENVVRIEERVSDGLPRTLTDFRATHDRRVNSPGPAVRDLRRLLESPRGLVIATVNFDETVERHHPDLVKVFADDKQFERAAAYIADYREGLVQKVPLLKLHGTISREETCLISDNSIGLGLSADKRAALESAVAGIDSRRCVYVGASMRDADITPILHGPPFDVVLDERWVLPVPEPTIEEFARVRQGRWQRQEALDLQGRLITESADDFIAALAAHWPR